ncbi:MAG: pitrilysin family protein, partial [Cyclobacteriaceae bacterium]
MLDRTKAPPYSHTTNLLLPTPKKIKIHEDAFAFNLVDLKQDVVKIEIVVRAGKWSESLPGVANFACQMLNKGTSQMNAATIAAFFDQHGAFFEANSGADYSSISLYSLTHNLEKVLPVFLQIVKSPSFPENEFELIKDSFVQNLKIKKQKTSYLASKALNRNLFGSQHPYGRPVEEEHVRNISTLDLKKFHQDHFQLDSIFIVGSVSEDSVKRLRDAFSQVASKITAVAHPIETSAIGRTTIDTEAGSQATIRMGKRSIMRAHSDYFDLIFLNHLLGGYFGSRLMKNIREDKGLTYGISSALQAFKNDSVFLIGADINKDKIELVFEEIRNELRSLIETPVTLSELSLAKNHFVGNLQIELASPFSVMEKIKKIELHELDQDYYQQLINKVEDFNDITQLRVA